MIRFRFGLIIFALVFGGVAAYAQQGVTSATVSGFVEDASGARIPDAEVAVMKKFLDIADTGGNITKSNVGGIIRGLKAQYAQFKAMKHAACLKTAIAYTIKGMSLTIASYQDWASGKLMNYDMDNMQRAFRSANNEFSRYGPVPDYRMTDPRAMLFGWH